MDRSRLLEGLTEAQREAVTHVEGPLLILAGPGSGKTRVVTHRIANLLCEGISDRRILALTFTNKAAQEMKERVAALVPGSRVWVGTFHRFAAQMLRRYAQVVGLEPNYTIYDKDQSLRALRTVLGRAKLDLGQHTPDQVANAISWAKSRLISPEAFEPRRGSELGDIVKTVYGLYQRQLLQSNAVDFDDLLFHLATILKKEPEIRKELDERYQFVMVDEYQDTNLVQYAIARALSIDHPNLAVTGDPDQSIYGWRGANLQNILDFERDYPKVKVVRLERNYRSTKRILRVADALIRHNVRRKQKELYTHNDEGPPVRLRTYVDQDAEARDIARRIASAVRENRRRPADFAIFYRVNALSRAFETALQQQGIPYQVVNGVAFFQRKEVKDVIAYLQLLNNSRDNVAFLRVINNPPRGIGATTLRHLDGFASVHGLSLFEAARRIDEVNGITKRSAAAVKQFVDMMDRLACHATAPMEELMGLVLSESGYKAQFENSTSEEDLQRCENIEELLTVARQFDENHPPEDGLDAFLEEVSLVNDTDNFEDTNNRVTLMTLHASKGLEFPVVFLVALEQGLLPHERSRDNPDQLEEERRLLFVGITRAQEELYLSRAAYRDFRGQRRLTVPSAFLMELPRDEIIVEQDDDVPMVLGNDSSIPGAGSERVPSRRPINDKPQASPTAFRTGAEMAGNSRAVSGPDAFTQGMVVCHPKHGVGRIVALSGNGANRKATVEFGGRTGRVKFVLSKAPLKPLKKK
ncbi:UvrD-helicase domain-containing protein [Thermostilla marina]